MKHCQENFQTAILSNAGDRTRTLMEEGYNLDKYVDEIIISDEEGVIKPDPEIYKIALDRVGANAETSLLLDDTMENVLSARQMGMRAIQFINNEQSLSMMSELLFQEN
jgi:putative hydrolase of the HAD superfamily